MKGMSTRFGIIAASIAITAFTVECLPNLISNLLLKSSYAGQSKGSTQYQDYLTQKLLEKGLKKEFVQDLMTQTDWKMQEKIIYLNVLGFRQKANYSGHISRAAV